MSDNVQRLVDLDDRYLAQVPFGRNRLLRTLGLALFGLAVQMAVPRAVHADPPYPCEGFEPCSCCSGASCCAIGCCSVQSHTHCRSGGQCWYVCLGGTALYRCCDYHYNCGSLTCGDCGSRGSWAYHCICRGYIGTSC
jgi:hypothetical protein